MERVVAIEVPVPGLVVLVGAAGSGKSTLAARLFKPDEVVSSDRYREVLTGDPGNQSATRLAFSILHREVARRLAAGRLVVVDATSVRPFARRALVRRAEALDAPSIAIVLDLPAGVVLARNGARSRPVPEPAVIAQLADLQGGLAEIGREGFAHVEVLRSVREVDAIAIRRSRAGL